MRRNDQDKAAGLWTAARKATTFLPMQNPLTAVDRAIGDFRRGLAVAIAAPDGGALALAAEAATPAALADLRAAATAPPVLALTASRARALSIRPSGHDVLLVPLEPWMDAGLLRGLADATTDLAAPLRGPFDREKRAPTGAEAAAVQLAKLARLLPAALVAPGAAGEDQLAVSAAEVAAYEREAALALTPVAAARVPLDGAENTRVHAFRPSDGGVEHLAIVVGEPDRHSPVLTRLHSECFTGDLLASLKCDCGEQLRGAIQRIAQEGAGVLLYLAQEGRGIGLMNKLRAYRLQEQGFDTIEANLRLGFDADERIFLPAAQMLRLLGFSKVRLLTNNPDKVAGLAACGVEVAERVPHSFPSNTHNELYLATKRAKSGHLL